MIRRPGILALLVFQALWLNVIVPGHTRGVVTLPGYEPASCHTNAPGGCCPGRAETQSSDDPTPGDGRAANCAVCFYAVRLTIPPAIDLTPAPLELLEIRDLPRIERLIQADRLTTYLGRAPPLA